MASARIEAVDLSKSFAGVPLFAGVSFLLDRGVLAVTGPNGSGKTTLLKILASLIRPSTGTVRVESEGRELSRDERRSRVGWSGPDLAFYPELTAEQNLAFFRRAAGFASERHDLRTRLAAVGLDGSGTAVEHFSTGMRQRLRIAFSFLLDPDVVLLDEPMAGLDADGREAVHRAVASAARRGPVIAAATDLEDLPPADAVLEIRGRETVSGKPKP